MGVGEIRKAAKGQRSVYAQIGLWAEKHGDWIQIHISGPSRTWVTDNPESVRFHATLFRDLKKTLMSEGCWPFDDTSASTPQHQEYGRLQPVPIQGTRSASELIIAERGE